MSGLDSKTLLTLWGNTEEEDQGYETTINLEGVGVHSDVDLAEDGFPVTDVSRYERHAVLGKGGMGAVYEAYDTVLHRHVATKALHEDVPKASSLWKRFYREAQITAQLAHPSIVPVYSIEFNDQHQPLLIMKRIQGVTLEAYLDECRQYQNGKSPMMYRLEQRLEILTKICDAMHYSHSKGVIHRDLKPENIMVGAFEDVYVMDWGVATPIGKQIDPFEEEVLQEASMDIESLGFETSYGQIIGTPRYMAPEQAMGNSEDIGAPSDQYAIGMMLYEMVTLKIARPGKTVLSLLDMAQRGYLPWGDLKEVDPRLVAIMRKATSIKPDERYVSTRLLAQDLRRFLRDQSVSALTESPLMRRWRRIRKHPTQLALGISILSTIGAIITIGSLWSALSTAFESARHDRVTTMLLNQINTQTQSLDLSFADVQRRVQRLAVRLESLHTLSSALLVEEACLDYTVLDDHLSAKTHWAYENQLISIEKPVCLVPNSVEMKRTGKGLWLASAMTPYIKQEFFDQQDSADFWSEDYRHTIQWSYVGFEDGVLLNFPGVGQFGEDYDPRQRPWYTFGKDMTEPSCGEPYPDASGTGYLLPCNQRVMTSDGELLGVVGLDFLVDSVLGQLEKNKPNDVQTMYLLDRNGDVLFSSLDKGVDVDTLKASDHNRSKEKVRFSESRVVAAVQKKQHQGILDGGRNVYVFARMQFVPWTLVYSMDYAIWREAKLE